MIPRVGRQFQISLGAIFMRIFGGFLRRSVFLRTFSEILTRFSRILPRFSGILSRFLTNQNFWGEVPSPHPTPLTPNQGC